jgi:hypothetical protein
MQMGTHVVIDDASIGETRKLRDKVRREGALDAMRRDS